MDIKNVSFEARLFVIRLACESMLIANEIRRRKGESEAYGEESFLALAKEVEDLIREYQD
jgi:hypothetical protein